MSTEPTKTYWKGIDERERADSFRQTLEKEFPEPPSLAQMLENAGMANSGLSRRSFLKATGFSIAGSMLASCARGPVEKAIPLLNKPENATPGQAYWYASTCAGCSAGCGILVKTRDGRPIKIEGNPAHPLSKGGICAVGQAMVLSLYDSQRLKQPLANGNSATWADVDAAITGQLGQISDGVYFLTGTLTSPSTRAVIDRFLSRFRNAAHVEYDAVSYSAILDAHEQTHGLPRRTDVQRGKRALPHYRFDRAEVIASFDADFLGTWISPVEFTRDYTAGRSLEGSEPRLSKHVHFEGRMSLTGANADQRIKVTPGECGVLLVTLAEEIARKAGVAMPQWKDSSVQISIDGKIIEALAEQLWQARGKSLVVCGMNDTGLQRVANFINHTLGNYGNTVDIEQASYQWRGSDRAMAGLVEKMRAGAVKALFVAGENPAYSLPDAGEFIDALQKVPLTVVFADHLDETAAQAKFVCPAPHFLESWNDAEVAAGVVSVTQPAIRPFGKTRSVRECLSTWMGAPQNNLDALKAFWQANIFPRQNRESSFQKFWDQSVHDGFALVTPKPEPAAAFRTGPATTLNLNTAVEPDKFALVLYQKIGMLDGRHAHNPWLHELPDPVTKAVWDNYVCIAPAAAKKLGVEEGEVVKIAAGSPREIINHNANKTIEFSISRGEISAELPVLIQPGQHENVVAVALGYGRSGTDRFAKIGPNWINRNLTVAEGETVGKNSFVFATKTGKSILLTNTVTLAPAGRKWQLARTQTHQTITVPEKLGGHRRNMVRETTLPAYKKDPASGNHYEHELLQLWPQDYKYTGHHWALAIDLNRCTGCAACVIGCQAENNVAVVGKDEVHRRREMHWIRIDRYYSGNDGEVDTIHQPVMCQHCDHAPCEGVCPVLATVHSDEGINQQIYNRCVGTRYCANNCPYKVRRFNWFDYWKEEKRENLALNPDITTRTRGVMEKCSLCVQRIQEAKAEAKRQGKPLADGDIKLACEQSCPAEAMVFGDMNDPESRISKLLENPRHYRMLEEMNFRPTVGYLTKVRNREADENGARLIASFFNKEKRSKGENTEKIF
ncbi:MAG: TAT-variant-translocated molybdopterin oxidoreductase [bacterium]